MRALFYAATLSGIFGLSAQAAPADYRVPTPEELHLSIMGRQPLHHEQCRYLKDMEDAANAAVERWKAENSQNDTAIAPAKILEAGKTKQGMLFVRYLGGCISPGLS